MGDGADAHCCLFLFCFFFFSDDWYWSRSWSSNVFGVFDEEYLEREWYSAKASVLIAEGMWASVEVGVVGR